MPFMQLLEAAVQATGHHLLLGVAPRVSGLPPAIQRYDDPFLPFGTALIEATHDLVCGYVFHLGAYLATGGAGARALERTLAYVPRPCVKILHGPVPNRDYVTAVYEDAFGADAVTLSPHILPSDVQPYIADPLHGVLVYHDDTDMYAELHASHAQQMGYWHDQSYAHLSQCYTVTVHNAIFQWCWAPELYAPTVAAHAEDDVPDYFQLVRARIQQLASKT